MTVTTILLVLAARLVVGEFAAALSEAIRA